MHLGTGCAFPYYGAIGSNVVGLGNNHDTRDNYDIFSNDNRIVSDFDIKIKWHRNRDRWQPWMPHF